MAEYMRLMVVCTITLTRALARGAGWHGDFCVELPDACIARLSEAAKALLLAGRERTVVSLREDGTKGLPHTAREVWGRRQGMPTYAPLEVETGALDEVVAALEARAVERSAVLVEAQRLADAEATKLLAARARDAAEVNEILGQDPVMASEDTKRRMEKLVGHVDEHTRAAADVWLRAWEIADAARLVDVMTRLRAAPPIDATAEQIEEARAWVRKVPGLGAEAIFLSTWLGTAVRGPELREQREALAAKGTENQRARWAVGRLTDWELVDVLLDYGVPGLPAERFTPCDLPNEMAITHAIGCSMKNVEQTTTVVTGPVSAEAWDRLADARETMDLLEPEDAEIATEIVEHLVACEECGEQGARHARQVLRIERTIGGKTVARYYDLAAPNAELAR